MPGQTNPVHYQPPVEWAQRKDLLFVTIRAEDCKNPNIEITNDKLVVKGVGGTGKQPFECVLEFFKDINEDKVRRVVNDRSLEFMIPKKESGPFWPRLLKSDKKMHWLKIDFNKWKDEDDEEDVENANNWDLNDMMGKMGGMGGFGGDEKPNLDDFDEDSDNEELPDLEDDKEDEPKSSGDHSSKGRKEEEEKASSASQSNADVHVAT
jgi:prostaglandin-E synthase